MRYLLLLIAYLSLSSILKGQNGYESGRIYFRNNDTIQARIKLKSPGRYMVSYLDANGRECHADTSTVKGYLMGKGEKYEFKTYHGKEEILCGFFNVLASGKLTLYYYKNRYFIQKTGDELIELRKYEAHIQDKNNREMNVIKKEYIGLLKYLISDSNRNLDELNRLDLNQSDLIKTVRIYNEGNSYYNELNRKRFKPVLKYGVELSYTFLENEFELNSSRILGKFAAPGLGIVLNYQFAKKLSFETGINYTHLNFKLFNITENDVNQYYNLESKMEILSLPLHFKFESNKIQYHPYLGIGAAFKKLFIKDFNYTKEVLLKNSNEVVSQNLGTNFSGRENLNYSVEVGCSKYIKGYLLGIKINYTGQIIALHRDFEEHVSQYAAFKLATTILF